MLVDVTMQILFFATLHVSLLDCNATVAIELVLWWQQIALICQLPKPFTVEETIFFEVVD